MFKVHLGDTPHALRQPEFEELARRTDGFSGSDISVVVKDVLMEPIRKTQDATHFRCACAPPPVQCAAASNEEHIPSPPGARSAPSRTRTTSLLVTCTSHPQRWCSQGHASGCTHQIDGVPGHLRLHPSHTHTTVANCLHTKGARSSLWTVNLLSDVKHLADHKICKVFASRITRGGSVMTLRESCSSQ